MADDLRHYRLTCGERDVRPLALEPDESIQPNDSFTQTTAGTQIIAKKTNFLNSLWRIWLTLLFSVLCALSLVMWLSSIVLGSTIQRNLDSYSSGLASKHWTAILFCVGTPIIFSIVWALENLVLWTFKK